MHEDESKAHLNEGQRWAKELERFRALSEIQGKLVALWKTERWLVSRIPGMKLTNDVVPSIVRLANERRYQTYIDIGALDGDTVVPVANLFPLCVAVEPTQSSFERLKQNLSNSRVTNCTPVRCALGDRDQEMTLFEAVSPSNNSVVPMPGLKPKGQVRMMTLDGLVDRYELVGPFLLKIDAEGNEYNILRGGVRVLQGVCSLVVEFWPFALHAGGADIESYIGQMKQMGYEPKNLRGARISWARLEAYFKKWKEYPQVATSVLFVKNPEL